MIRTQVYIPDDLHAELRLLARREGVNFSQLIREGVKEVISRRGRNKISSKKFGEGFIGAGKTSIKTNAVKDIHDYYRHGVV